MKAHLELYKMGSILSQMLEYKLTILDNTMEIKITSSFKIIWKGSKDNIKI